MFFGCLPCCGGGCRPCQSPAMAAARRFAEGLMSPASAATYAGLYVSGSVSDSVFSAQWEPGAAYFQGQNTSSQGRRNIATALHVRDSSQCSFGRATVSVPVESANSYIGTFTVQIGFNRYDGGTGQESLSPNIFINTPVLYVSDFPFGGTGPLITEVRFGGTSISGSDWDGSSEPTVSNAIPSNTARFFPSNNCRWQGSSLINPDTVTIVPASSYDGTIEIDWKNFNANIVFDGNEFVVDSYFVEDSGTVQVRWDDMAEIETACEECNALP